MTSIDRMASDVGDSYYPEFADTIKYILQDIYICIIKKHCSNQDESK